LFYTCPTHPPLYPPSLHDALPIYHDVNCHFPAGTVSNSALPPDKRLGWPAVLWPAFMNGGTLSLLDPKKSWESDTNCPPRWWIRDRNSIRLNSSNVSISNAVFCLK